MAHKSLNDGESAAGLPWNLVCAIPSHQYHHPQALSHFWTLQVPLPCPIKYHLPFSSPGMITIQSLREVLLSPSDFPLLY